MLKIKINFVISYFISVMFIWENYCVQLSTVVSRCYSNHSINAHSFDCKLPLGLTSQCSTLHLVKTCTCTLTCTYIHMYSTCKTRATWRTYIYNHWLPWPEPQTPVYLKVLFLLACQTYTVPSVFIINFMQQIHILYNHNDIVLDNGIIIISFIT